MGTVTQYNLANIQAALGGGNPISMSEYYRGGPYVPSTRTSTVSEGPYYSIEAYDFEYRAKEGVTWVLWATSAGYPNYIVSGEVSSFTSGGYTYFRGAYVERTGSSLTGYKYHYRITRQYQTSTAINTGVPSSGAISINQLYGAQNP